MVVALLSGAFSLATGESPAALQPKTAGQFGQFDDSPCDEWRGVPPNDAAADAPMSCGVMWYLHVPKTGGTTMMHHLHSHAEEYGWKYADMWKMRIPKQETNPLYSPHHWKTWNMTEEWKVVLDEREQPKPKLIVHHHHNVPGLGDSYMLNQVLSPMAQALTSKGCEFRFTTVLREPVSELKSLMLFRKVKSGDYITKVQENADAMSKYLIWNFHTQVCASAVALGCHASDALWPALLSRSAPPRLAQWPKEYSQPGEATPVRSAELLKKAREILIHFSLVGRTEELDSFIRHTNLMLGWPADLHTDAWVTGSETGQRAESDFTEYELDDEQIEATKQANKVDSHLYHTYCQASTSDMFLGHRASGMQLVNWMLLQSGNASTADTGAQPFRGEVDGQDSDPLYKLAQVAQRLSSLAVAA